MQLSDLLGAEDIDPKGVLVFRHAPKHLPKLRKDFLWLAENNPDLYNAYQQTQSARVEKAMLQAKFVASFIGHEAGKALFIGMYRIIDHRPMSFKQFWKEPRHVVLRKKYGMYGMTDEQATTLWFDLEPLPFAKERKGKMVIRWPKGERAWCRWANQYEFPILDNGLSVALPNEEAERDEMKDDARYSPNKGDWRKKVARQIRERRGR